MDLLLWRNRSSEDQEPPEEPFNGGTRKSEIISTGRLGYQTRSAHRLNLVAMECTDWTIMTMLHFQISQSPHNSGFLCQETLVLSGQSVPGPTSPYKQGLRWTRKDPEINLEMVWHPLDRGWTINFFRHFYFIGTVSRHGRLGSS